MTSHEKLRDKLAADIAKYLAKGGEIRKIPKGVSNDKGYGFRGIRNVNKDV